MANIRDLLKFIKENGDLLLDNPEALLSVETLLRKAKEEDFGDGFSIVDHPDENEDDEAAKWLAEAEAKQASGPSGDKKTGRYVQWSPRDNYSKDEQSKIDGFMKEGYSHREAERMAGAHKGPNNMLDALRHNVLPSMPSEKMLSQMKELAGHWLENADKSDKKNADIYKNPMKHAAGKMDEAHENATADFSAAYHDFISKPVTDSDGNELKGRARHKAIKEWKDNWKKDNPDHEESVKGLSDAAGVYGKAHEVAEQTLQEKLDHIASGAHQAESFSTQEGVQHAGGVSGGEDAGMSQANISKDPSAAFAASNPKLMQMLNDEQKSRMKRIKSTKVHGGGK